MPPSVVDLLADAHVVDLPLRVTFRGLKRREAMLLHGPYGWAEFAPFTEYGDTEAARWLASAIEAGWCEPLPVLRDAVPVNATVPAVPPSRVAEVLAAFPGCTTVKVKVAERGQDIADDVGRLAEVRRLIGPHGRVRVDANAAWDVDQAVSALARMARHDLEYAEQPCPSLDDLRALRLRLARAGIDLPIAADESVRKADDPLRVALAGAADVVVIKVAPLGGARAALDVARWLGIEHHLPVVVSSALDTSVGLAAGVRLAAALPDLKYACGLGTASLFAADVTDAPLLPDRGALPVRAVEPSEAALADLAAPASRRSWWVQRLRRVHALIPTPGV